MKKFWQLVRGEFLKQKRSFTWPLVVLTPVLGAFLSFINLFLRYDYLMSLETNQGLSSWQLLLIQHHFVWAFLFPLVATLFASQVHYLEYKSNSWKQALALPVSRGKVYFAKWSAVLMLNSFMVLGNSLCLFLAGKALGFPEPLDTRLLMSYTAYQLTAVTGLLGMQCWLSACLSNANVALTIGCVGVASSLFLAQSEQWARFIPYTYTIYTLPDPSVNTAIALYFGLTFGLVFLIIGLISFQRKEIY